MQENPAEDIRRSLIPTAEQEALREPAIDPVFLAAGGISGGLNNVSRGISRNLLLDRDFSPFLNLLRELKSTPTKDFGTGLFNAVRQGILGQALGSELAPRHPIETKVGSLPVGQGVFSYLARLTDFAQRQAGNISRLPE